MNEGPNIIVAADLLRDASAEDLGIGLERGRTCRHDGITVVEATRTVKCKACGLEISAFEVLLKYARQWRSLYTIPIETLQHEKKQLTAEVKELKRQRKNLKAQIRRLRH